MSQDRDNEGAIWKNDVRATDRHPHFKGKAFINGVGYWVSAWKRDPDGNPKAPALKLAFEPMEQRPRASGSYAESKSRSDSQRSVDAQRPPAEFDDEIPF